MGLANRLRSASAARRCAAVSGFCLVRARGRVRVRVRVRCSPHLEHASLVATVRRRGVAARLLVELTRLTRQADSSGRARLLGRAFRQRKTTNSVVYEHQVYREGIQRALDAKTAAWHLQLQEKGED